MSESDSFINEVSEEVRRDRLYRLFRRYGWIAIALVILIVGGASVNEWRKATARAEAEALGDALLSAFEVSDPAARADALSALDGEGNASRSALIALAQAAAEAEAGNLDASLATLEALSVNPGVPQVYRDVAAMKSVLAGAEVIPPEERIQRMNGLALAAGPFRLLALEQIALAEIELGRDEAALETLREILVDANITEDLRRRASQLIVALGGSLTAT
ncbi:MAG: hypothetical protein QNJ35_00385 [Paracoccaceae bacterium]|nr:hypothetical protein [Paracoccaceae bacterium]